MGHGLSVNEPLAGVPEEVHHPIHALPGLTAILLPASPYKNAAKLQKTVTRWCINTKLSKNRPVEGCQLGD